MALCEWLAKITATLGAWDRDDPDHKAVPFCDQSDRALALGGVIATGDAVLASLAVGADFACIGSALIATEDARTSASCALCIVDRAVGQAHRQAYGQAHEQRIIESDSDSPLRMKLRRERPELKSHE